MGVFTRLAKDTAIYGFTIIIARFINYFFISLYTRVLETGEYGIYSEIMAYVTLLQVFLAFGLETGFFRFANRNDQDPALVFSTISRFLLITSSLFFVVVLVFSGSIANFMGYAKIAIIYTAAILAIDAFTSVFFAKLRNERKGIKFASFKMIKIASEIIFNLVFFLLMPKYFAANPNSILLNFISATPSYIYILAAILCSGIISILLFIPDFLRMSFKFSGKTLKQILWYSLPLMIAGLPGIANDSIDKLLFRFLAPDGTPWESQVGIFNANAKLAVIILLFVQMFRYAAEPFFFSSANQPNIKKVYADVMKYFTAFCMLIFVFITMYMDLFAYILGPAYRSGIVVVPIMLLANVLLGINQNLSMWYKLSDKTNKAIIVTMSGFAATLLVNIIFMPYFGALAAACGHFISYAVMIIISYRLSLKHYYIPYEWGRIGVYMLSGVVLFLLSLLFTGLPLLTKTILKTILLIIYIAFILKIERINPISVFKTIKSKFRRN